MGVLDGFRILELGGLGPGPFAGMLLADMGAEIIRIERGGARAIQDPLGAFKGRGRRSIILDLKDPNAVEAALRIVESCDGLIEGFRPGVMERLGLGPEICLARNPRLVFGRMTGYGQEGPLAPRAGHDINYLAMAGVLYALGDPDRPPTPPLNLIGDYGGGGMLLVVGMLGGLLAVNKTGRGQVVDAAMVDGAAQLMSPFFGLIASGVWREGRGQNLLDGAAYYYRCYRCADDRFVAVGAIEPQFHANLLSTLGLDPSEFDDQQNSEHWPRRSAILAAIFETRTRDDWAAAFEEVDACVTPVLSPSEASQHPHAVARRSFLPFANARLPAPAPRFGATSSELRAPTGPPGLDTDAVLRAAGLDADGIAALRS